MGILRSVVTIAVVKGGGGGFEFDVVDYSSRRWGVGRVGVGRVGVGRVGVGKVGVGS
jgi:hypothetical protein